ncbi:ribonuclease E/G [uncultured Brevundimonas sp.]|uniref:ribonuclease E/G n=1 Tax=uncultured Brevundimonas sp. TaxID=213418 RepID=UPI00259A86FA|nr:ribonuclease E/G [uncultured Brevundimonas sp.]
MTGAADPEVFLDDTPGETRGVIARGGLYTHLLIHRDADAPQHRLGARSVGRVTQVNPGLRGAFVDLGAEADAFLPLGRNDSLAQGARVEVVVVAEPRGGKGSAVRRLGPGEGAPRLLEPGPSIADALRRLAPGAPILTGVPAIDASREAESEALAEVHAFPGHGLDLAVQRTRALVAVDIDYAPAPGRDPAKGRARANAEGLRQAARLIGLKAWGGLVIVDAIGDGRDGEALSRAVRAAFAEGSQAAFGPVSRFGLAQLSLPWTRTPVEEVLSPSVRTHAQALVRDLRRHILTDTATARVVARCAPEEAAVATPLVAALGPRAAVVADPSVAPGRGRIQED